MRFYKNTLIFISRPVQKYCFTMLTHVVCKFFHLNILQTQSERRMDVGNVNSGLKPPRERPLKSISDPLGQISLHLSKIARSWQNPATCYIFQKI